MRLHVNIFLWTLFATLVPVTALVLGVTAYSQQRFQEAMDREANANLNALVGEIDNRLRYEREVIRGMANSPAVQGMLQALQASSTGYRHPDLTALRIRVNAFLAGLQRTVPGLGSVRLMDAQGNSLVKVTLGRVTPPMYDSLGSVSYVEEELSDTDFLHALAKLPPGEISYLMLPNERWDMGAQRPLSMLYAVTPLTDIDRVVGYLAVNTFGEYIDRLLNLAPRIHGGTLLIAERDLGEDARDGLLLYDDLGGARYSDPSLPSSQAQDIDEGAFWEAVQRRSFGVYLTRDGRHRIYYQEYHPYTNTLSSWIVALRLPTDFVRAPYADIRSSLVIFALFALGLSLALAWLGARYFARPIVRLGNALKAYADGRRGFHLPLRSHTHELRLLENAFNYMADRLDQARAARERAEQQALQKAKMASIGEMAAGIGHEINNPLNNILSLTRLIERDLPAEARDARRDITDLREEALRVSRIVRGVMNFARQLPPAHEAFDAGAWLSAVIERLQGEAMDADIDLRLMLTPQGCIVEADPSQLEQVLVNLVRNALQASPAGQTVLVEGDCDAGQLTVSVLDRGHGIPPELISRVFDPFFTTKPVDKGTGLGLSVSLGIVQYHGGQLELGPRPDGAGTLARFTVPRRKSPPQLA